LQCAELKHFESASAGIRRHDLTVVLTMTSESGTLGARAFPTALARARNLYPNRPETQDCKTQDCKTQEARSKKQEKREGRREKREERREKREGRREKGEGSKSRSFFHFQKPITNN